MPSIGWRLKNGSTISYEEALTRARSEGAFERFPPPVLQAMQNERVDQNWLSPSSAGGCPRQRILQQTEPYYQNLDSAWTAFTGNAYHREISILGTKGTDINEMPERFLFMDLHFPLRDGSPCSMTLQGTADMVYAPKGEPWTIYDWKTISDFMYFDAKTKKKVMRILPDPDHVLQINLYGLMLRWQGIEIDHLYLWYVKSEGKKDVARKLIDVPIMDMEDLYHLACELAEPLAWYQSTGELPQNRYDPDWKPCRFCPLVERCQELHHEADH